MSEPSGALTQHASEADEGTGGKAGIAITGVGDESWARMHAASARKTEKSMMLDERKRAEVNE